MDGRPRAGGRGGRAAPGRGKPLSPKPSQQTDKRAPTWPAMIKDAPYIPRPARQRTDRKRAVQEWKGERMVRRHSFLACVQQIAGRAHTLDVVKIGIVGSMGTGKSTLAQAVAHAIHVEMKAKYGAPFAVRTLGKDDLLKLDSTLRALPTANYILIFDDVSFLSEAYGAKSMAKIKNTLTTIRHREGRDVKFVIIYNYHYGRGMDKFLRQTDFKFFTTIGDEEDSYMSEAFGAGGRTEPTVREFRARVGSAQSRGTWQARVGKDSVHVYKYRDPWIPVLFADGQRLRHAIGPTRQWLAPRCPTCSMSEQTSEIDPATFMEHAKQTLGAGNVRQALKLIALENGVSAWPRGVTSAKQAIEAAMGRKQVSLERLLIHCGIEPTRRHRRASHDQFVSCIEAAGRPPDENKSRKAAARRRRRGGKKARAATAGARQGHTIKP